MAENSLWDELLTLPVLRRGWHIAREGMNQDFAEIQYEADVIASDLDGILREVRNRLQTETYTPRPLFQIEVPKGTLGFRPGTVIPLIDRIVLCSIVYLLAPKLDPMLPASVYSWRLKDEDDDKGSIFNEGRLIEFPFLKKKTIARFIDPFESWYSAWPEFDTETRSVWQADGYRYLAVSDISAYFENIQLPILRDQLMTACPEETKLINLLCSFLEGWTERTGEGRNHLRGIPQGSLVGSFLGNFFLLPLDLHIGKLCPKLDLKYFRYMDDVRIFAREREHARLALFDMNRVIRSLHLNVQSAKTKILDERSKEISRLHVDERVDRLTAIIDKVPKMVSSGTLSAAERDKLLAQLDEISERKPDNAQPIKNAMRPLEGLSLRAFMRWIHAHHLLDSHKHVRRLLREMRLNSDHRLTRKMVRCTRDFPRLGSLERLLLEFMESEACIFSHQRAECLRALRYLSRLSKDSEEYARNILYDSSRDPYERMQAAYLLSRFELRPATIEKCLALFREEPNTYVQMALAGIIVQRRNRNREIIQELLFHPNEQISRIGRQFRALKNDPEKATHKLKHIFRPESEWLICDSMPFIAVMAVSENALVRETLDRYLEGPSLNCTLMDMREALAKTRSRVMRSLGKQPPKQLTLGL